MFYKKAALQSCYFIKKETPTQVFSCEHRKIFYRTSPVAASALFSVNQIAEITAQKMKFSIKDFFSKCNQVRSFLRIWSHLLLKSLIENFIFVQCIANYNTATTDMDIDFNTMQPLILLKQRKSSSYKGSADQKYYLKLYQETTRTKTK